MSYIKETFNFSKEMPFSFYETDSRQEMIHSHDCLELNYIIDGTGYYLIEDKSYPIEKGDIFLINNLEHHMAVHENNLKMLVFVFDQSFVWESADEYDYLKPFFERGNSFSNKINRGSDTYEEIRDAILHIKEESEQQKVGWVLMTKAWLMVSLAMFYRYYSGQNALDAHTQRNSYERIRKVVEYIHNNFSEELSLEELSSIALMNKSYLSGLFTKVMHMRVFDYIELVRINHSKVLLKTSDLSILEIALESGFKSSSYFSRIFRKLMGMTPNEYRKI